MVLICNYNFAAVGGDKMISCYNIECCRVAYKNRVLLLAHLHDFY